MIVVSYLYAGNINFYSEVKNDLYLCFDGYENYIKQTYRSRCTIYGANGKLDLIIPIVKGKQGHRPMRDVKISYAENWQKLHWKSLESAYRSSPYFEFYEHEFIGFYTKKEEYLIDFNFKVHSCICKCLNIETKHQATHEYQKTIENANDLRKISDLIYSNKLTYNEYTQVFADKHGFIPNLSVLDLLFNNGPHSVDFL